MNLTIRPVKKATSQSRGWCGPSALSILTGLDTVDTARLLREVSGKPSIKGVGVVYMQRACERLGLGLREWTVVPTRAWKASAEPHTPLDRPLTLIRWLKDSRAARSSDTFLIVAGHHYSVVQGRRYCCGLTKTIVGFADIPHRKACIDTVYKVLKTREVNMVAAVPPKPPKGDATRALAKALAAKHGIQLESISGFSRLNPEDDGVFVYPPVGLYDEDGEGDPLMGERSAYSWQEILAHVRVYSAAIEGKTLLPSVR